MGFPASQPAPLRSPAVVVDCCCYWYSNFAMCLAGMSFVRIINKQQHTMDNGKNLHRFAWAFLRNPLCASRMPCEPEHSTHDDFQPRISSCARLLQAKLLKRSTNNTCRSAFWERCCHRWPIKIKFAPGSEHPPPSSAYQA